MKVRSGQAIVGASTPGAAAYCLSGRFGYRAARASTANRDVARVGMLDGVAASSDRPPSEPRASKPDVAAIRHGREDPFAAGAICCEKCGGYYPKLTRIASDGGHGGRKFLIRLASPRGFEPRLLP